MNPKVVEIIAKAVVAALGAVGVWLAGKDFENRKKK